MYTTTDDPSHAFKPAALTAALAGSSAAAAAAPTSAAIRTAAAPSADIADQMMDPAADSATAAADDTIHSFQGLSIKAQHLQPDCKVTKQSATASGDHSMITSDRLSAMMTFIARLASFKIICHH